MAEINYNNGDKYLVEGLNRVRNGFETYTYHLLRLSTYEGFEDKEEQKIFRELMRIYAGLCDAEYVSRKTWQLYTPSKTVLADLKKLVPNDELYIEKKD